MGLAVGGFIGMILGCVFAFKLLMEANKRM